MTARYGRLIFTCGFISAALAVPVWADPLQGRVEETQPGASRLNSGAMKDEMEAKLDQLELQGGAQGTGLNGGIQGGGFNPLHGTATAEPGPMNLSAANDPDGSDRELQIGWDRWRNTLTQAIQAGTVNKINVHNEINFVYDQARHMMVSRYPLGISAWYAFEVQTDRRIINIRLTQSSGYQAYDQAVLQSIVDLQGNPILIYPNGSKRQIVTQQGSVRTAPETHFQNFQFGDVERQRH